MRVEETRAGRDVFHQRYIRADKSGHCCACAPCDVYVLPNLGPAESEPTIPGQFLSGPHSKHKNHNWKRHFLGACGFESESAMNS